MIEMSPGSRVKVIFSGLSMSGVSSITSLFVTGCYRGSEIWYHPNENWTKLTRKIKKLSINIFDLSGEIQFLNEATSKLSHLFFKDTTSLIFILNQLSNNSDCARCLVKSVGHTIFPHNNRT